MEPESRSVVQSPTPPQVPPPPHPHELRWLSMEDEHPETEETIRAAVAACNAERAAVRALGLAVPDMEMPDLASRQVRMHATLAAIHHAMDRWGTKQVLLWTQSAAAMRGYREE